MKEKIILGIKVNPNPKAGTDLQSVLTKYGGIIKTRLGLNEISGDYATREGIILLELADDSDDCHRLENELLTYDHLEVKKMVFQS